MSKTRTVNAVWLHLRKQRRRKSCNLKLMMTTPVKVFSTPGSRELGDQISEVLAQALNGNSDRYHVEPAEAEFTGFSNQNIEVQVNNVRDHVVIVVHTQTPPVSEGLVELFALLDAINNAHPRNTFMVFPYMPYSRSDRKNKARISVMGQRLPEILNRVLGVRRALLVEPHDPHIKQYFVPTADEIPGVPLLVRYMKENYLSVLPQEDCVVVFADSGAAKRFEEVPSALALPQAYIHKYRADNTESPMVRGVTGQVEGKHCFIVDDEILTGNTVLTDAAILKQKGAASVRFLAVHGVYADKKRTTEALMRDLANSLVDEFVVTDTIPVADKVALGGPKFKMIPIAPLLGEATRRLILGESVSELHHMP